MEALPKNCNLKKLFKKDKSANGITLVAGLVSACISLVFQFVYFLPYIHFISHFNLYLFCILFACFHILVSLKLTDLSPLTTK